MYDYNKHFPMVYLCSEPFSLQTALDSFFASEKLEYACAKCDCKEAHVTHKFTKLPR